MLASRFFPLAVLYLIVEAHPELYFTELNSDKYWLSYDIFIFGCHRLSTKKKALMKWSYLTRFKWKRKWFVYLKVVEWELKFWKLSQGRTAAALVKRREEKLACTLRLSQLRPSLPPPLLPLYRPTRWPSCQRSVPFQPLCVLKQPGTSSSVLSSSMALATSWRAPCPLLLLPLSHPPEESCPPPPPPPEKEGGGRRAQNLSSDKSRTRGMFHPSSLCYSPSWQASTGFRERVTSDLVVHRVIDIWMVKLSRAGRGGGASCSWGSRWSWPSSWPPA